MSSNSIITIVALLVLVFAIAEAAISLPPPKPDCDKNIEQDCKDKVRDAICKGRDDVPVYQIVTGGCAIQLKYGVNDPCFFDVLAKRAAQDCKKDPDVALATAIDIWRYVQDGSQG